MTTYFILQPPDSERLMANDSEMAPGREAQWEYGNCPITPDHTYSGHRISPLYLQVRHNRRDEAMIWFGSLGSGFVVQETLLNEFEKCGFTGYQTRSATVRFRDGSISTEYREFIVTGWAGMARPESGIRLVKNCPACLMKRYSAISDYGNLIDWTQWTGDDFFIVWPMPLYTFVSDRFAQWLQTRRVKSFWLMGPEDRARLIGKNGFGPGRLSDYLPEELAIKYGRPLGL